MRLHFSKRALSCSPMFKRVLDCWSSKAPPLPLLQYVRVWNSHCGDMPVVHKQGLQNLQVYGSSHVSFDMVQIIHVSMYFVQQQGHVLPCSRGSLTPGHPTTPLPPVALFPQVYNMYTTVAHHPQVYNIYITPVANYPQSSSIQHL